MTKLDRALFADLLVSLNPAPTSDDIWRGSSHDVPELHKTSTDEVFLGLTNARQEASPLGVAVLGRAGAGKTHLLGAIRERIQRDQLGYFFLVSLNDGRSFWPSTAAALADGFRRNSPAWGTQHKSFFRRLTAELGLPAKIRDALAGDADLTPAILEMFVRALRSRDSEVGRECQHTARALALQGSSDFDEQDIGDLYLQSQVVDEPARSTWGLPAVERTPQQIVRDITRLIALTRSPSIIAFDQLDLLIEQTAASTLDAAGNLASDTVSSQAAQVAHGLVDLREKTHRTLIVVSCLPDTWVSLTLSAPPPFEQRFRETHLPDQIKSAELARRIIAARFAPIFAKRQITRPETWPVKASAFTDPLDLTPRQLLRKVSAHLEHCLLTDTFSELSSLTDEPQPETIEVHHDLGHLDTRFEQLVTAAEVGDAFDPALEDQRMTELLTAGLQAWIIEQQAPSGHYKQDVQHAGQPQVHARLIEVLDEEKELEATWCFRAIASQSANAVISRVTKAVTKAGITLGLPNRRLALLRNDPWPSGVKTQQVTQDAVAAGAVVLPVTEEDLKVFAALRELLADQDPGLRAWLVDRRKASQTALFSAFLPSTPSLGVARPPAVPQQRKNEDASSSLRTRIFLGNLVPTGEPFRPDLASLRKHTVIFAGSGSGKTVLVRRLVEECALLGVSSIVLDSNNDLVRLGQAWPQPPEQWAPGDADKAADYFAHTEVVVWTPRITAGRPLAFQPLPDFGPVRDDVDELGLAVDAAVAALAGRVGAAGPTEKAKKRRAVLTEVMRAFAADGGSGLDTFVERLANLSDGQSKLTDGKKIAQDLAEAIKAEMINDVLFGGEGTPADPGVLLTPTKGKRARVSVISLAGLTAEQQTGFVNQLQMALSGWIKQNPAGDRPLGGLLVMDEAQNFAPAAGGPPSTESTIWLAQQARKYGLGLVLATQAPKGIHNKISGNATTQFFGRLSVPVQIAAAKEVAASRGANISDIGTLQRGQFYVANDDVSFVRIDSPLCLSYHGPPLTREEIVVLAASDVTSDAVN